VIYTVKQTYVDTLFTHQVQKVRVRTVQSYRSVSCNIRRLYDGPTLTSDVTLTQSSGAPRHFIRSGTSYSVVF